jgi:hypothetical protein
MSEHVYLFLQCVMPSYIVYRWLGPQEPQNRQVPTQQQISPRMLTGEQCSSAFTRSSSLFRTLIALGCSAVSHSSELGHTWELL